MLTILIFLLLLTIIVSILICCNLKILDNDFYFIGILSLSFLTLSSLFLMSQSALQQSSKTEVPIEAKYINNIQEIYSLMTQSPNTKLTIIPYEEHKWLYIKNKPNVSSLWLAFYDSKSYLFVPLKDFNKIKSNINYINININNIDFRFNVDLFSLKDNAYRETLFNVLDSIN